MRLSPSSLDLIKRRTGLSLKAHQDPAGTWFIGYQHYGDVHEGMEITEEEAQAKLEQEIGRIEPLLAGLVQAQVNQGQWDALVMLVFDFGFARFRSSMLLRHVNNADFERAAGEFPKWNQVNGRPSMTMVRRREIDQRIFQYGTQPA
ncbi:lysozyme [Pseudomonas wadenswilerensis]